MVAVGSRTLDKAQAFIQETGAISAKAYGSYEEVLTDAAVHGVYIPLPTSLHLEWVKKAAAKGKHILLEKPIATVSGCFVICLPIAACMVCTRAIALRGLRVCVWRTSDIHRLDCAHKKTHADLFHTQSLHFEQCKPLSCVTDCRGY